MDPSRMRERVANLKPGASSWFKVYAATTTGAPTRVDVYDDIGMGGWFSDGLTSKDFAAQLSDIPGDLEVHINSGGGDVFEGIAIYNAIASRPGNVTTVVDGIAASIASVIAQAGKTRIVAPGSMMMIHDGLAMCMGNAADMREMAGLLDQVSDNLASIYSAHSGNALGWRDAMRQETWYSAEQAVAAGLADRLADRPTTPDAVLDHDLTMFAKVPPWLAKREPVLAADVDESAWDGGAAMSSAASSDDPASAYKAICAGRKEGDPSKQSSWALPHHKHPGDAPNAAGVRNALARLPQTQGLTNEAAAKAHLQAHMNAVSSDGTAAADQFDPETVRAALRSAFASKEGAAT